MERLTRLRFVQILQFLEIEDLTNPYVGSPLKEVGLAR